MDINGIAHIQLTVNRFEECRAFYKRLFEIFEMKTIFDEDGIFYGVGGRTGIAITRCAPEHRDDRFIQKRIGLHHLCFRLRSREDVDQLYDLLKEMEAKIVHPPEEGPWAPGYYSLLFEDPDGIRLEVNFIPGKGNLNPAIQLPKPLPKDL
jgi:catechol 2,3-dioxygenase-like lactoylglutathione lyase family enzyme